MRIIFLLLLISTLPYSCSSPSKSQNGNSPPTVSITNIQSDTIVNGIVEILCSVIDNDKIQKVELLVDSDTTGIIDFDEPYKLLWDTRSFKKDSYHYIQVKQNTG